MHVTLHSEWFVYQDNVEYTSFNTQEEAEMLMQDLIEAYPDSTFIVEELYVE